MTAPLAAGAGAGAVTVLVLGRRRPTPGRARPRPGGDGVRSVGRGPALLIGVAGLLGVWLVLGPLAAVAALGSVVAVPRLVRRQARARQAARVARAVPDLVDVFLVAVSAGHPVAMALMVVGPRVPMAVRAPVVEAGERFRRGLPLADCLEQLGTDLGPTGAPLAEALRQAAASGVPAVPLLEGVAASARDARRRRAEEEARRLPVTMLFPLVLCILPAAVVLAVVPVLVVSIASLSP